MKKYIDDYFNFNYGLIAIDNRDMNNKEIDDVNILHFCAYEKKPTRNDADSLLEELKTDKEFGLTEIGEFLVILPAPKDIVEQYKIMYHEDRGKLLN